MCEGGLSDLQKLKRFGNAGHVQPGNNEPTIGEETFAELISSRDTRFVASVARVMAAEGREREAVAAVLKGFSSADSASALEVLWDVLDALVWVSDEEYVHLFTAHVADLVKSHSDKVDHDKFYNMLGRWWRVFPPPVVKAACDAYTHNPPPLPPDYEQKLDSYNKGKEKVESKLKKRRRHQAENLLDAAEGEIRNGQITEAAELFRRYEPLADIPPSKTFLFQRGKTSLALKKHDEAMQDAVQLMERESKSDWVGWELCGAVYKDLEEFEAAAQSFATALQKQPPKPDFERVAKLLVEVRYELLIKDNCRKAIPALKQRAVEAFIEENYTLAAFCYTKLITLDPARGHLYHSNRSATYTKLRKYRLALQDADIVIDLFPQWPKGHTRKAAALAGMKKEDSSQHQVAKKPRQEARDRERDPPRRREDDRDRRRDR